MLGLRRLRPLPRESDGGGPKPPERSPPPPRWPAPAWDAAARGAGPRCTVGAPGGERAGTASCHPLPAPAARTPTPMGPPFCPQELPAAAPAGPPPAPHPHPDAPAGSPAPLGRPPPLRFLPLPGVSPTGSLSSSASSWVPSEPWRCARLPASQAPGPCCLRVTARPPPAAPGPCPRPATRALQSPKSGFGPCRPASPLRPLPIPPITPLRLLPRPPDAPRGLTQDRKSVV